MKNLILLIFITLFQSINAQVDNEFSIFHRLLVFNSQNELLIVNIENTNLWVTPGLYQDKEQTIKNRLNNIASTYGIELTDIKLKGTFILKRDLNGKHSTSLRHIYTAKIQGDAEKTPNGIAKIKWLSPTQAMEKITFPHINEMIKQIIINPNEIWGGTLLQYKENDIWKTKVLENFYTL